MRKKSARKERSSSVNKSKKKLNFNLFLAIFLIALLFCVTWFLLKINKIYCVVDGQEDAQFCQNLEFLHHKSLFFTRYDQTPLFTSTLVNDQGQVFEPLRLEKKLPDTLTVFFHKKNPVYKLSIGEDIYMVNSLGYLADDSNQFDLPTVYLSDVYLSRIDSKKLEIELHNLISNFIEYFNQQKLIYNEFSLNKEQSVLVVDGVDYIFEDTADPALLAAKIKIINNILSDIKQDLEIGEEIELINLRFNLPVIKLKVEDN